MNRVEDGIETRMDDTQAETGVGIVSGSQGASMGTAQDAEFLLGDQGVDAGAAPETRSAETEVKPKRSRKLIAGVCILAVLLVGEIGLFAYLLIGHKEEIVELATGATPEPTATPDPYPENAEFMAKMSKLLNEENKTMRVVVESCARQAGRIEDAEKKSDLYRRCAEMTDKYLKENAEELAKEKNAENYAKLKERVLYCMFRAEAASPSSTNERLLAKYHDEYSSVNTEDYVMYFTALADARDSGTSQPEKVAQETVLKAKGVSGRGGGS